MEWFSAPDYWLTRWLIERSLALVYLIAFANVLLQFVPLLGTNGLLPVPRFLAGTPFREAPSLFQWRYSDRLAMGVGWVGAAVSALLLAGVPQAMPLPVTMGAWALLYLLYLSIVNVGQTWYAFGWESLLLEAGFLAIFLGNDAIAPPFLALLGFRWLAFRVELGAGLIKLRGDRCWRDLTCMDYHHETQPMPNPLSWWFHRAPRRFHRLEVLGNYAAQLVAPFGLFLPQPFASLAAGVMIATQGYLVLSGNYAWLNVLTMIAALAAVSDGFLRLVLPIDPPALLAAPPWFIVVVLLVSGAVLVLSWWPLRNLVSGRQLMNFSFNRYHLVNTYGAFGSVGKERIEVVIEGTDGTDPRRADGWREYEFRGKPTDPHRRPPQIAPYHLRLDWLMWFAGISPMFAAEWFPVLVTKLLEGDRRVLGLLRANPFPDGPPRYVRARTYLYRFSTRRERRDTGAWWRRELVGEFLPPVKLP